MAGLWLMDVKISFMFLPGYILKTVFLPIVLAYIAGYISQWSVGCIECLLFPVPLLPQICQLVFEGLCDPQVR